MSEAKHRRPHWHVLREHATHWVVGGVLIAATGFAPEEWFARTVEHLHLPENVLHLWNAGIDVRVLPIALGVAFIVGDLITRKYREHTASASAASQIAAPLDALPLPDRPSIAVLPFDNLSGDPEQEYFSDGVAEDIITELSRNRTLFVIARNSSFTYRGRSVDIKQVGRELGVRYVLEGSVRRDGDRIRVTAQLIEADSGTHVWAERYDRDQHGVFAIQDEITHAVVGAIGPAVADAEMHRAMRRPPNSLGAWDLYQQAMWHLALHNPAANQQARNLFLHAIEQDPMFAAAYSGLARGETHAFVYYQSMTLDAAAGAATMHARKAIELDPADADAHASLASTLMMAGDLENALSVARHALALNPNCAYARWVMGANLVFTGRHAEGREVLAEFERLSPRDANMIAAHRQVAISYYLEGDYARCIEVAQRQLSVRPDVSVTYRWLAAALAQLGRIEEARAVLARSSALSTQEAVVYGRTRVPWMRAEDHEHLLDGLRKAGWQS